MSKDNVEANVEVAEMYCASCGITEVDDIKLNKCNDCGLARCDKCQIDHLPPKYEQLRRQQAAELRDEILFRQPESTHLGDCPICCLPLSLIFEENTLCSCCSTTICNGCDYASQKRELEEKLEPACPFCRRPVPKKEEENLKFQTNTMKRAKANDPVATIQLSRWRYGEGDYVGAFEYIVKAAEQGDVDAYTHLSHLYREGLGVEKDEKNGLYYLEEAAIAGHPSARYNLAGYEWDNERYDRAVKHFIIAANLGYDKAIQGLKDCYKDGHVSKEEFAAALRAHQAAVDATKSPQRETAAKA
ncbi:Sel1-like repeat family protein [Skeletonema marinoi]|uniref:Sel1-like repeat family protein n=1 Tax=Skeletonema marinoi TaxID=267567 RepID=A0AAD8XX24_9STRA|nr:Sel1-like repeat family protein [Skeletonema marinoi]